MYADRDRFLRLANLIDQQSARLPAFRVSLKTFFLESYARKLELCSYFEYENQIEHYDRRRIIGPDQTLRTQEPHLFFSAGGAVFKSLVRPAGKKRVLELIYSLPNPRIKTENDLKIYYHQQKKKYGFQSFFRCQ
jgi:hypothetical protein